MTKQKSMKERCAHAVKSERLLDGLDDPSDIGYNRGIDDALSAIEALPDDDWRDIESAPKDGTPFVAGYYANDWNLGRDIFLSAECYFENDGLRVSDPDGVGDFFPQNARYWTSPPAQKDNCDA